ncbi:selenocysteine insertion sequence-binding protein 2-like [Styela clava]
MDQSVYMNHATNLSAEVEPFIPRSDVGNMFAEHMIQQQYSQGQGPQPLPHYLTSCYPFVQDPNLNSNQRNEQQDYQNYYNRDARGWPPGPNPQFPPHMPPPNRFNTPPPQVPPPNLPQPSTHTAPIYSYQPGSVGQVQYQDITAAYHQQYHANATTQQLLYPRPRTPHQHKRESSGRKFGERNKSQGKKRSVGIQMEIPKKKVENETEDDNEMVDNMQQTDFPSDIASKSLIEKPSPLKKTTRSGRHRKRATNSAPDQSVSGDSSDNNGGDEADVDSDSGYYSPKHQITRRNHLLSSGIGIVCDDRHEIGTGTAIHPYQTSDLSPQRVVYLPGPPPSHPFYQVHPNSYLQAPAAPGQILRLPSPGTPPVVMTPPPPLMNLAPGPSGSAVASFKSRSTWEQEVLKAHNVAPICPPAFVPRQRASLGQNHFYRGGGHQGWRYPRYQGPPRHPRHPVQQAPIVPSSMSNNMGHNNQNAAAPPMGGPGMLRLNPNTAPSNLVQQNPPQLTDEDFPDLRSTSGASGHSSQAHAAFSYSAALQNKPKPEINIPDNSPIKSIIEPDDSGSGKGSRRRRKKTERAAKAAAEEYAEISKEQENIKKQLNKKTAGRTSKGRSPHLDLAEMLTKLEQKNGENNEEQKQLKRDSEFQRQPRHMQSSSDGMMPHNPLDSSAPMKKRGKEREIPRAKKPSALKKVILKEREERNRNRIDTLSKTANPEFDIPNVSADFFNTDYTTQKENLPENNASDNISTSEVTSSDNQSPITVSVSGNSSPIVPANLPKIHSRRYREYCSGQVLDKQIDEACIVILQKLVQFQERMYRKDPVKAKSKRRFVLGIREVTKHLKLKKLRCVLISPNLEKIQSKGGLDDALQQILLLCKTQSVPHVFALGRCAMGRAVSKLVPVSIIGIFDYSGVEDSYKKMLDLVEDAHNKYQEMMMMYQQEVLEANTTPPTVPPTAVKRFAHMGHSRNPSAASCVSFCSMISEPISEMNPSEGASWRNMMEVTDEQNPVSTLPPENVQEDERENEQQDEKQNAEEKNDEVSVTKNPAEDDAKEITNEEDFEGEPVLSEGDANEEVENGNSSNQDSYLNALDTSGSLTSEEKVNTEASHLDKSFSTVSTVVARTGKESSSSATPDIGKPSGTGKFGIALPGTSSDTNARINSWLEAATSSVQDLEIDDPIVPDPEKLEKIEENLSDEDDDFVSTHEDEVEDSYE